MCLLKNFSAIDLLGNTVPFSKFANQVILVVNTASKCAYRNQYAELETLYRQFLPYGFSVLAFPCNQFGLQEPGQSKEIVEFCQINYQISFPVFQKISVNGRQAHPFFKFLKENAPGLFGTKGIKWNFTKFLLDRNANVVGRWSPITSPLFLVDQIRRLL